MKRDRKNRRILSNKTCTYGIKYAMVLIVCAIFCVYLGQYTRLHTVSVNEEDFVRSEELAGYLQVIPMTPDETRAILLPNLGEYLTGKDVTYLFHYLQISTGLNTVQEQIAYETDEKLTRRKWCLIYEIMLDTLNLIDQVDSVKIQYLGNIPQENHLIADNGNYDCDLDSIDFEYGKTYEVYVWQNKILGKKSIVGSLFSVSPKKDQTEKENDLADEQDVIVVPKEVRVVLSQDNRENVFRSSVYVKGTGTLDLQTENEEWRIDGNQVADCIGIMDQKECSSLKISPSEADRICICTADGKEKSAYYRGNLIVYRQGDQCWIVNELDMEAYLYGVVPGEMPEQFESEALKAQAVCARTYACFQIADHKYDEYYADLMDTTASQVYLPFKENEKSIHAVEDTAGEILTYDNELANIYYFSTSCGSTSGMEVWNSKEVPYLQPVSLLTKENTFDPESFDAFIREKGIEAYDSESRYFRWTAEVDPTGSESEVKNRIQNEYVKDTANLSAFDMSGARLSDCSHLGKYKDISLAKRSVSGAVTDLQLSFENGIVHIYNENTIRTVLGAALTGLKDKNEESANTLHILPSAMFSVEQQGDGRLILYGGGLGHGIGMSQYGADGMAKAGMNCEEILLRFFPGTKVTADKGNG